MRNIGKEKEREWNSEREVWWLLVAMFAFHRETGKFHIVQFCGGVKCIGKSEPKKMLEAFLVSN
jgi:hypothetical protein